MVSISVDALTKSLDALCEAFPAAVESVGRASAQDAWLDLGATAKFRNITYGLRDAFSVAGSGEEWRVFIDPSAPSRYPTKKTPPWEYGMYLNSGTQRNGAQVLLPRLFMEHAAEAMLHSSVFSAEQALSEWLNGA